MVKGDTFDQSSSKFFAIMPRGKQFDVGEKTIIMTLFTEGVAPKEIAMRLKRNTAAVRKVIAANRDLPAFTSPPPPKKRSGRPRMMTAKKEERLRKFLLRNPFKTAKEVKAELHHQVPAGWGALPHLQEGEGLFEGEECERDGLARQFAGSQPHREPPGHHEEEA
jgi:transposase